MKKILIAFAIILFTINANAQQTKSAVNATPKKESCCAKNVAHAKMTPEEKKKCEAKCKAENKKCTAAEMAKCENHSHAKMTPEEIKKCEAKCKAEGKKCTAEEMTKSKTAGKSCCAKK